MKPFPLLRAVAATLGLAASVAVTAPARAGDLLGAWVVAQSVVAPWSTDSGVATAKEAKRLTGSVIVFGPRIITSRDPMLSCREAQYEPRRTSRETMFGLAPSEAQRKAAAQALKVNDEALDAIAVGCSTGHYSYVFRDPDTTVLTFRDRLYVLHRKKATASRGRIY